MAPYHSLLVTPVNVILHYGHWLPLRNVMVCLYVFLSHSYNDSQKINVGLVIFSSYGSMGADRTDRRFARRVYLCTVLSLFENSCTLKVLYT